MQKYRHNTKFYKKEIKTSYLIDKKFFKREKKQFCQINCYTFSLLAVASITAIMEMACLSSYKILVIPNVNTPNFVQLWLA